MRRSHDMQITAMSQDKRKNSKVPELTSSGGIEKVHQKSSKKKNRTVSKGHVEEARKGDKLQCIQNLELDVSFTGQSISELSLLLGHYSFE